MENLIIGVFYRNRLPLASSRLEMKVPRDEPGGAAGKAKAKPKAKPKAKMAAEAKASGSSSQSSSWKAEGSGSARELPPAGSVASGSGLSISLSASGSGLKSGSGVGTGSKSSSAQGSLSIASEESAEETSTLLSTAKDSLEESDSQDVTASFLAVNVLGFWTRVCRILKSRVMQISL